jgi:hypothetical protein
MELRCAVAALSIAVVAAGSCSGTDGTSGGPDGGSAGSCQVTLSGAVTGTFSCILTLVYTTQNDRTTLGLEVSMPAPENMINGVVTRPGKPSGSQTWTNADSSGTGEFFVQSTGLPAQSWISAAGTTITQGTYSLTLMPGSGTMVNATLTNYAKPSGSFTTTLLPGPGTPTVGMVTMTGSF